MATETVSKLGFTPLWAIGLVLPLMWVIHVGVLAREDRYLEGNFGDAYRAYKARVRRWI